MPPSTEPVKRRVILAVQAALQGITGGASYWNTVAADDVRVTDVAPPEANSFPAIFITPARTQYDNPRSKVVRSVAGQLDMQLTCLLRTATDVNQSIERFVHDVHTALYADNTLGGIAIDVRVTADESMYPTDTNEPICGFDLFVSVDYRAARSDLTTTAT